MNDIYIGPNSGLLPPTTATSIEALNSLNLTGLTQVVYDTIRDAEGITDDEGEVLLTMRHQTYSSRRWALMKAGLVVRTGERRETRSGRQAWVWVVAAEERCFV